MSQATQPRAEARPVEGVHITLFMVVTALFWAAQYVYNPKFTPFVEGIVDNKTWVGLILAGYGMTQMLLRLPLGLLSDRLRIRKPFFTIGCALITLAGLGMYLFPTPWGLLLMRCLGGASAATWVTTTVLFSSYYPRMQTAPALQKLNAISNLGQMLAMLAGGAIAGYMMGKAPFLGTVVLGCAAIALSFFLKENRPAVSRKRTAAEVFGNLKDPLLISCSALAALHQLIQFSTISGFTQSRAQVLRATDAQMGILMALFMGGMFASSMWLLPRMMKRMRISHSIMLGFAGMGLGSILTAFVPSVPLLLAIVVFMGVCSGIQFPTLMGISIRNVSEENRGLAMGLFQSLYGVGMTIGPLVSGAIYDAVGMQWLFILCGGIGFAAVGLSRVWLRDA